MTALLRVQDLCVRFRTMGPLKALATGTTAPFIDAVYGVSFEIHKGETLALVGDSGSGKSTIARTGLDVSVQGEVLNLLARLRIWRSGLSRTISTSCAT
ncbi:ATP-binding cassette domain-containing protein [Mesorhizobium sp. M1423]|uniref:ATP-binding cassette domain-containing protein n=1 Tax=Mesorhizobium sp. M1423 TaxID=2957101 RepID=UPI003335948F